MNKKQRMHENIRKHGEVLNHIFETGLDPVVLCKKLRRLETEGNRQATAYCNGDIEAEAWEDISDKLLERLEKILKFERKGVPVFINSDPRGYTLKIHDSWVSGYNSKTDNRIYTDWGGYGILAPDFRG